jgi:hypothetical protein
MPFEAVPQNGQEVVNDNPGILAYADVIPDLLT